jgi:hypothetical protein
MTNYLLGEKQRRTTLINLQKTRFRKAMKKGKPNLENISAAKTTEPEPTFLEFSIKTPALSAVGKCDTCLRRTPIFDNKRNFQFFV